MARRFEASTSGAGGLSPPFRDRPCGWPRTRAPSGAALSRDPCHLTRAPRGSPPRGWCLVSTPCRKHELTPLNRPSAGQHNPNGLGVDSVLLDQNPRRERVHRVIVQNRNGRLNDDRARVQLRGDEMHRRATDAHAVLEGTPLRVAPGKRRKQGWMDVQDPIRKCAEHRWAHKSHVTGQAHEINITRPQGLNDGSIERIATLVADWIQRYRFEAGFTRT